MGAMTWTEVSTVIASSRYNKLSIIFGDYFSNIYEILTLAHQSIKITRLCCDGYDRGTNLGSNSIAMQCGMGTVGTVFVFGTVNSYLVQ